MLDKRTLTIYIQSRQNYLKISTNTSIELEIWLSLLPQPFLNSLSRIYLQLMDLPNDRAYNETLHKRAYFNSWYTYYVSSAELIHACILSMTKSSQQLMTSLNKSESLSIFEFRYKKDENRFLNSNLFYLIDHVSAKTTF